MQPASNEYKDYLKEGYLNSRFLNTTWQSLIELGAINQQAQESAYITLDAEMVDYSSVDIFEEAVTDPYATYELNRTKADGSLLFKGEDPLPSGIVSSQISDENCNIDTTVRIRSSSTIPLSVKGITLTFSQDVHAADFTISDKEGNVLLTIAGNHNRIFINDFVYTFDEELIIHITKLSRPYYRFRLENIKLGLMLRFDSDKIMSMSFKEQLQLISTEMYTSDLSVTIDNQDGAYDIENPSSEVNFLEQAQRMNVSLSLSLPSGAVEKIQLGTLFLSDWSAKLRTANFTATDRFNLMTGTYDKDVYHSNGITLYDLAVDVLQDAGIPEDEYLLDVYLRTIKVNNPVPILTHKEALQLIANAGRCILKQDRNGRILMKSSFIPDTTMTSENKMNYSDMNLSSDLKDTYATYEHDFTKADGKSYFYPGDRITGYVSESLSDDDCLYSSTPHIMIDFEAPANLFSLNIFFGNAVVSDFLVTTYLDDGQVEALPFTGNTLSAFCLNYPFMKCNRILITFTKSCKPYQRVYVHSITFDTTTDKYIGFNDIGQGSLEGTKLETVKQLEMVRTIYTPDIADTTSQVKITKFAGDEKETVINFGMPMYTASAYLNGNECGYDMSAWRIKVDLDPPQSGSKEYTIQIMGKKLNAVKQTIPFVLNPTGAVVSMENPLISDAQLVRDTGGWIVAYLKSDREYSYTYLHGDPSLDTNDIIHQENKYIEDLQTQIYAHELSIAGAVTGRIKARKVIR